MTEIEQRLFSVPEVAKITGVSQTHLRRLIEGGKVHVVRIGQTVRIPREEIDRLEREGTE